MTRTQLRSRAAAAILAALCVVGIPTLVLALPKHHRKAAAAARAYTLPLNSASGATLGRASVRSPWTRVHLRNPQSDRLGLTLRSRCLTTGYFAYRTTGWTQPPAQAAATILAGTVGEPITSNIEAGSHGANGLAVDPSKGGASYVLPAGRGAYDALVVEWTARCAPSKVELEQLGSSVLSFHVG